MFISLLAQAADPAGQSASEATANTSAAREISKWLTPENILELVRLYAVPLLLAIVILIVAYLLANITNRGVRGSLAKAKIDETLSRFFGKLARYSVITLGMIVALGEMGVEVTAFAAVLAAAGFAVGMALSGTLSHFASGIMLLIFRPFRVGDFINAGGVSGKVHEIELFTTALDTPDNRRIYVPNGAVYGSTIENVTQHTTRRVDVTVGVEYSADIDKTRDVLDAAVRSVEGILVDPPHAIVLVDLGQSSVNWVVRVWCPTADYWSIKEKITRAVKMHLDQAGIGIPFPQMVVHMNKSGA